MDNWAGEILKYELGEDDWEKTTRQVLNERDKERIDQLTGLLKADHFNKLVSGTYDDFKKNAQLGEQFDLFHFDLDFLKGINDDPNGFTVDGVVLKGHPAGNYALSKLGEQIRQYLSFMQKRGIKALGGRVGGEECRVLLYGKNIVNVQEELENAFGSFNKTMKDLFKDKGSVSIGWTTATPQKSLSTLYEESDTACYLAKKRGNHNGAIVEFKPEESATHS